MANGQGRPRTAQLIRHRDAIELAVSMRARGMTMQDIADDPRTPWNTKSGVSRALTDYLRTHPAPDVEDYRRTRVAVLNEVQREAWSRIDTASDRDAAALLDSITKAVAEQAKLTGAYAPVQTQLEISQAQTIDTEIEAMLAELVKPPPALEPYQVPPGFRLVPADGDTSG